MKKILVVVEASGKIDHLQQMLKAIGRPARVMATLGHVGTNPASLRPIALDSDLRETHYQINPDKRNLVDAIRQAAYASDKVYLAMDDDQEGDVIAYDLAGELSDFSEKLERVRLRAITESELERAFANATAQDFKAPAHSGTCRRIVDRAVGATFSVFDEKAPISTGRVQSSLLAQLAESRPVIGNFVLEARIASGDKLQASVPVYSLRAIESLEAIQKALDQGKGAVLSASDVDIDIGKPWGYEEVVLESSIRLKIGIEEAAKGFQDAYERGKVSYPRTRANGFTEEAIETARRLAKHNRAAFNSDILPRRGGLGGTLPHETPRALDDELQLGRSLAVLDTPDAIAVLVARNMIECGQRSKGRRVDVEVDGLRLSFQSLPAPQMRSWKVPEKPLGLAQYTAEQALLRFLTEKELGRPSTVVAHVKKFLRRDLVQGSGPEPFKLTGKGMRWLAHAQDAGLGADTSRRMELRFAEPMDDPSRMARAILQEHGLLGRVQEAIGVAGALEKGEERQEFAHGL